MRNYLKYELKRNLLAIIVLTVMFVAIQILVLYNARIEIFIITGPPSISYPPSQIGMPMIVLIAASILVPMFVFAYKNDTKTLDCLYGMPIKSRVLVLTKIITTIVIVLMPWTIGYWTGVIVLAIRGAEFNYIYYLATYAIMVPIALLLIGFSAFLFTRANRNIDGAVFVILGSSALMVIMLPILAALRWYGVDIGNPQWVYPENWTPFFGVGLLFNLMNSLIVGSPLNLRINTAEIVIPLVFMVLCILAWFLLIFTAPQHKAEDAGSDSNSFYGYRVMIPLFTFMVALSLIFNMSWWWLARDITNFIIIIIGAAMAAYVAYVWFRRSFKIKKEDLIVWGSTILAMIIAAVVVILIIHFAYDSGEGIWPNGWPNGWGNGSHLSLF